ncbi:MAG TPA: tetratricopeptide repeat protein [Polyangiaceae bacterium]
MEQQPPDPLGSDASEFAEDADARDREQEPLSQVGPESTSSGEEFLFHLYRGSELLQDNCISEAKEELEQALAMQPQDVEGQGLLGIVYFRLGLYPRAIKIYREIVTACPTELTPRVNLALCYIKTGQLGLARRELEAVISRAPERKRAWGYLGLVFERLGDLHKARAAFERAAQDHMVHRMDRLISAAEGATDSDRPERLEVRQAAADAVAELETANDATSAFVGAESADAAGSPAGHWRAIEPGDAAIPPPARAPHPGRLRDGARGRASLPPLSLSPPVADVGRRALTLEELAQDSLLLFPSDAGVVQPSDRSLLVRVREGFSVRQETIGALLPRGPGFTSQPLMRRQRSQGGSEPMGGHTSPFVALEGQGDLVLTARHALQVVQIQGGFAYLRESALVGFESTVHYEHGRLSALGDEAVSIVQLSGRGVAVFERRAKLRTLPVRAEQPATVRARLVLGWTGRLLTQPMEPKRAPNHAHGFVAFSGDGAVFLEVLDDDSK